MGQTTRYTVDSVVCDYGVFRDGELQVICNSRRNALLIKDILEKDERYAQGFVKSPQYTEQDFNAFISRCQSGRERTGNGKRLIDADVLLASDIYYDHCKCLILRYEVENAPTVDAVEVEKYNELWHDNDVLKRLINGEWVDTEDVQKALGIDFSTGMRMFEFSRTAKWNPAPLNGQYIETKFRLKRRRDETN